MALEFCSWTYLNGHECFSNASGKFFLPNPIRNVFPSISKTEPGIIRTPVLSTK